MPNWCTNKLSVRGRRDDIAEFLLFMSQVKGEQGFLDLAYPMPNDLKGTSCPPRLIEEHEYATWVANGKPLEKWEGAPITYRMQAQYRRIYGADNWYDWSVEHWGTKWDVYEKDIVTTPWKNGNGVTLVFDTAWAPPSGAIARLSGRFPKLQFNLGYEEPGMALKDKETYGPHESV